MDLKKAFYCTLALIGVSLVVSLIGWCVLPSRVPVHFDASWQPNAYGPKSQVAWVGPGLMAFVAAISFGACALFQEGVEESGIEPYLAAFLVATQVFLLGYGAFLLLKVAGR